MANILDDLLAEVTAHNTVDDSLIALTGEIHRKLDEALSGVVLPPAVKAKVEAIFKAVSDEREKVAAAVLANTDQEEPPVEP